MLRAFKAGNRPDLVNGQAIMDAWLGGGVGRELSSQPLIVGVDELVSSGTEPPDPPPWFGRTRINQPTSTIASTAAKATNSSRDREPPPRPAAGSGSGAGSEGSLVV